MVQAATTLEYYYVADRLRALGFTECSEEGAPICRWTFNSIIVDIMPTGEAALGFSNRWYDWVFIDPLQVEVAEGLSVRVPNVPTFCATKFEAFSNRGQGDYMGNSDFEDIVTVMAHCSNIAEQILQAPSEIRAYLVDCAKELISLPRLQDYVAGCFSSDRESQSVVPGVLESLICIAKG